MSNVATPITFQIPLYEREHMGEQHGESFVVRQLILLDISVNWAMFINCFLHFEGVNWM
jgi:hypothetical protein